MPQMVFLVIAIVAVGLLALVAMVLGGKHRHSFNVQEYQTRWLKIENSLEKGDERSYRLAIIDADKLVDRALNEMGIPGKSMGEKLKKIGNRLPDIQKLWHAHKLRNQIVHESDFEISYNQARQALSIFRQTLKNLGAI